MNNWLFGEKKKPVKQLCLTGFSSICISTGGERGSVNFLKTPVKLGFYNIIFEQVHQ